MRNKFTSEVREGFEKIAQDKGWLEPTVEDIVKSAKEEKSIGFTDDLFGRLMRLASKLRSVGKIAQADSLEDKTLMYKMAKEEKHLYHAQDEELSDLLDMAHSGDVKMAPAENGLGDVETLESQHEKMLKVINKQPTGKYASFLGSDAASLSLAGKVAKEALSDVDFFLKKAGPRGPAQPNGPSNIDGSNVTWFIYPNAPEYAIVSVNNKWMLGKITASTTADVTIDCNFEQKYSSDQLYNFINKGNVSSPSIKTMQVQINSLSEPFKTSKVKEDGIWGQQTTKALYSLRLKDLDVFTVPGADLNAALEKNNSVLNKSIKTYSAKWQQGQNGRSTTPAEETQTPSKTPAQTPTASNAKPTAQPAQNLRDKEQAIKNKAWKKVYYGQLEKFRARWAYAHNGTRPVEGSPQDEKLKTLAVQFAGEAGNIAAENAGFTQPKQPGAQTAKNTRTTKPSKGQGSSSSDKSPLQDDTKDIKEPPSPLYDTDPKQPVLDIDDLKNDVNYADINTAFKSSAFLGKFNVSGVIDNTFWANLTGDPMQDFEMVKVHVTGNFGSSSAFNLTSAVEFLNDFFQTVQTIVSQVSSIYRKVLLNWSANHGKKLQRATFRLNTRNTSQSANYIGNVIARLKAKYQLADKNYREESAMMAYKTHGLQRRVQRQRLGQGRKLPRGK